MLHSTKDGRAEDLYNIHEQKGSILSQDVDCIRVKIIIRGFLSYTCEHVLTVENKLLRLVNQSYVILILVVTSDKLFLNSSRTKFQWLA